MLLQLSIENLGLIERVGLEFGPGLTVLTGETGAGKSLIIGALSLLAGGRADSSTIRTGADEARVSAIFTADTELRARLEEWGHTPSSELLVSRVVCRDGKNRCWLDGRPATLRQLNEVCGSLIDLHGQHEQQRLLDKSSHLDYLDRFLGDPALVLRKRFSGLFASWRALGDEAASLKGDAAERERRADFLAYQIKEIEAASLREDEEEALLAEREILRHAELLAQESAAAHALLSGEDGTGRGDHAPVLDALGLVAQGLGKVAAFDPELEKLAEIVEDARLKLEEAARSLAGYPERIDFSSGRLDQAEERLAEMARLKRKYGESVGQVLDCMEEMRGELAGLSSSEERLDEVEAERERLASELVDAGSKLSDLRSATAEEFSALVISELEELGLPSVRFEVRLELDRLEAGSSKAERAVEDLRVNGASAIPHPQGFDRAEFLISPNPGEAVAPLRRIASGGEISRTMIALKSALGGADAIPTLVFDEIDTGIGGHAAALAGAKLARLSRFHQLICVTHLPQIGCFADRHVVVTKEQREGRRMVVAQPLSSRERVEELARMLSGELSPELSRAHAKELLKDADQRKATV